MGFHLWDTALDHASLVRKDLLTAPATGRHRHQGDQMPACVRGRWNPLAPSHDAPAIQRRDRNPT